MEDNFDRDTKPNHKIFDTVIRDLSQWYSDTKLHFISYNRESNELTIKIKFIKKTHLNICNCNVYFYIKINYFFPESSPSVYCYTNFTNPTVFDQRDILHSIIDHNWTKDCDLRLVINKIPYFISRVIENNNNKMLVYYGDYEIDKVYEINDFTMNLELKFFKINQRISKGLKVYLKERYVILTDLYFLLFDPVYESKNNGRLLFWGDIRQISACKGSSISSESLTLEWINEESNIIKLEMIFLNSNVKFFMDSAIHKINKLKTFKIFQEDIIKPIPKGEEMDGNTNIEKIVLLIKYKEEILEKNYSLNMVKELLNLYQKIIEFLSAKNDESFRFYIEKVHKLLQTDRIQNSLSILCEKKISRNSEIYRMSESTFSTLDAVKTEE